MLKGLQIELFAQLFHAFDVFLFAQWALDSFGQHRDIGGRQFHSIHDALAEFQIVALKNREGDFFTIARQKVPIAGAAGVIDRRVTPAMGRFGAGRAASFYIGLMRIHQTKLFRLALTGANHAMQRGQVFRLFDHFARAAQNGFRRKLRE